MFYFHNIRVIKRAHNLPTVALDFSSSAKIRLSCSIRAKILFISVLVVSMGAEESTLDWLIEETELSVSRFKATSVTIGPLRNQLSKNIKKKTRE